MNEKIFEFLFTRHTEDFMGEGYRVLAQQLAVKNGRIDLLLGKGDERLLIELKKGRATNKAVDQVSQYKKDLLLKAQNRAIAAMVIAHAIPSSVSKYAGENDVDTRAFSESYCYDLIEKYGYTLADIIKQPRRLNGVLQSTGTKPRTPVPNEEAYRKLPASIVQVLRRLEADERYYIVSGGMHTLIHYRSVKVGGANRISPKSVFISSGLVINREIEKKLKECGFFFARKDTTTGEHSWWQSPFENTNGIEGALTYIETIIDEAIL